MASALRDRTKVAVCVVVVVGLVALAVVGTSALRARAALAGATPAPTVSVTTTTVVRTSLSDARTMPGTLGFGAAAPLAGHGEGTVTWLPAAGAVVGRGAPLYRVDDRPVPILVGATPLFRTLSTTPPPDDTGDGSGQEAPPPAYPLEGSDVTVVADNLVALGYDIGARRPGAAPGTTRYTAALAKAVRAWQHDLGVPATGTLGPGDAVVLPGDVRVDAVLGRPGDPVAEPLLSLTTTTQVVTVPVAAGGLGAIAVADAVTVVLPDTTVVPATVTAVTPAQSPGDGSPGGGMLVTVAAATAGALSGQAAGTSVQVRFAATTHPDVLAVPIDALLALAGGGYALQRPDGSLVAVVTGLFADGQVEVSGEGVHEGLLVVSAS